MGWHLTIMSHGVVLFTASTRSRQEIEDLPPRRGGYAPTSRSSSVRRSAPPSAMGDLAKGRQAGFGNDAWVSEMTDRLSLTRAFEGAGIQSELAEPLTTEIYNAIHESVAT